MKFPTAFTRYVGECPKDATRLGDDKVPTGRPTGGNHTAMRLANINGWPVQRIVVGYQGPDGAPPVPATVYMHDDSTGSWFRTDRRRDLEPGTFTYFDLPVLTDNPNVTVRDTGSIEVVIVPEKPANAPAGKYVFVVGGDVSSTA